MKFSVSPFSLSLASLSVIAATLLLGATLTGVLASSIPLKYKQHGCTPDDDWFDYFSSLHLIIKYDDMNAGDTCNDACYKLYGAGSYFGFGCPTEQAVNCLCYAAGLLTNLLGDLSPKAADCNDLDFQYADEGIDYCDGRAYDEGLSMGGNEVGSIYKVLAPPVVDCLGKIIDTSSVTLLDFKNSEVTNNTLHEKGGELRYRNIATVGEDDRAVSLVVTVTSGTYTNIKEQWEKKNRKPDRQNGKNVWNGGKGELGVINLQTVRGEPKSGEGNFKFCFHYTDTDKLAQIDRFDFTIFDLDQRKNGIKEKLLINATTAQPKLWPNTTSSHITLFCEDEDESPVPCEKDTRTVFHSSTKGNGPDNPKNPSDLTKKQKKRSVAFTFIETACFEFTYDHYCPDEVDGGEGEGACDRYSGGNFLFGGAAHEIIEEGACVVVTPTVPSK